MWLPPTDRESSGGNGLPLLPRKKGRSWALFPPGNCANCVNLRGTATLQSLHFEKGMTPRHPAAQRWVFSNNLVEDRMGFLKNRPLNTQCASFEFFLAFYFLSFHAF